ncbi:hypothetical protein HPB48_011221 [Haemaphysalis longicornis]|uniref:Uncharacterized protein n=1 Tax=Haemaphysalis longicornis TaxID=44386 RepID=A0A9J6G9X3_HAELO|nr:hypothetical protein HPB48_011221 [Haemaphysalis longicornis]
MPGITHQRPTPSGQTRCSRRGRPLPYAFQSRFPGVAQSLKQIPHLPFGICAYDITVWVPGGKDGHIENTLQAGVDAFSCQATLDGLTCSSSKAELLILPPCSSTPASPQIEITVQGHTVPRVSRIRIFGLIIQQNRDLSEFISRILAESYAFFIQFGFHVDQIIALLPRVTNRHHGLHEKDRLHLVHSFSISRLLYTPPYIQASKLEMNKIDGLIRKVYRAARQIPLTHPQIVCSSSESLTPPPM